MCLLCKTGIVLHDCVVLYHLVCELFTLFYRDMTDLKEIHQELNTHIHDQGEGIDRIGIYNKNTIN